MLPEREIGCSIYINSSFCVRTVINFNVGVLCCYNNVTFHMTDVQSDNTVYIYFMILLQLFFLDRYIMILEIRQNFAFYEFAILKVFVR